MAEIKWREWGEESFNEARQLDRPILLDIGAVWCHWCHVMDHGIPGDPVHTGTYSNAANIEIINRDYVPIKVDNDRRPDINARYNMGGWPTTAFLTPDGDPLYGATYLTPGQMLGLLESIATYYRDHKSQITGKIKEHAAARHNPSVALSERLNLTSEMAEHVASDVKQNFDPAYGGFGTQPKFPHPDALNFALEQFAKTNDDYLRQVAEKTLDEMSSGGMYDQFAGGFFRYSTTRDWTVPHFEKMLEDNSRLLETYLLGYQILGHERYKDTALDIQRFLMDVLYDSRTGAFAGSQDADKEDEYYGRPLSERQLMPTPYIDWTVYADWNALVVTAFAGLYRQLGDLKTLSVATRLYEFLAESVAPFHFAVDGKGQGPENQLSDVVALLGAALDLFETTGHRRYLSDARGLADTAQTELFSDPAQQFRDTPVTANALGALAGEKFDQEDNAHFAKHLIKLGRYTSNARYLNAAELVLKSLAVTYRQQSYFSSAFVISVSRLLTPDVHVVLVGELTSQAMESLKAAAYRAFAVAKTVELRSAEDSGEYLPDPNGKPVAYVCIGTTCSPPCTDPRELGNIITQASKDVVS